MTWLCLLGREPTDTFMKTFFALTKSQAVESQTFLNNSAILSYANLVRNVYVSREDSEAEYPVNAFGKFRSKEGRQFVEGEYLEHLEKKLQQAVQRADSHQILVYIRALGNTGHRQILKVFKPYFEGEKQISQFQRLQMVIALDKLVDVKPQVARSVLYKIYQNPSEEEEIRVAAVYQLMRAVPPASMLQRMAEYTNYDNDDHVNAAVKSWIESAADLEGEEYEELSSKAQAALPLLTEELYGIQLSQAYIRSRVVDEMNVMYSNALETIGSDDSYYPQGLLYAFSTSLNGADNDVVLAEALVSSVDELTNVLDQQLKETHEDEKQKKQATSSENKQYSSKSIIEKLKMQFEEREQLEGAIRLSLGEAEHYFTFNNQTLDEIPDVIKDLENRLKKGKKISYTKFVNKHESTIAVPTVMGLPAVFQYEMPTVIRVEGEIKMHAQPAISNGDLLQVPDSVHLEGEIEVVVSSKIQSSLSFFTPHNHQQHYVGYDKNIHVYIPIKSKAELDLKNEKISVELEPLEPKEETDIVHYSTVPYVAQQDILDLEPVSESDKYEIVQDDDLDEMEVTFGKHHTGMEFSFEYESDEPLQLRRWLHEQLHSEDLISTLLLSPAYDDDLAYTNLNLTYNGHQSSAHRVQINLNYESEEYDEKERPEKPINWAQLPQEQGQRAKHFLEAAASKIHSADVDVIDAEIEFKGDEKYHYYATAAYANSPVDKRSRVLGYVERKSSNSQAKPYKVTFDSRGETPNTNELDYEFARKFGPKTTNEICLTYGRDYQNSAKINIKAELTQSEERKQYLDQTADAQECKRDIQEGNRQLPVCANVTAEANLLDQVSLKVEYSKIGERTHEYVRDGYQLLSHLLYEYIEENEVDMSGMDERGQLEVNIDFEPDFSSLNITVDSKSIDIQVVDLPLSEIEQQIYVAHPVFSVYERVWGELNQNQVYWPFCTIDKHAISTFDNVTYDAELGQDWSVVFHYVPDYAKHHDVSPQQQRHQMQVEEHVVLARGKQHKEIKITARAPETDGKLIEIDLKHGQSGAPKVSVNQQEQKYDQKQAAHVQDGYIQIYELPNQEVKIEIGDDYYVIYDGERAKITVVDDKFNDALRGLCGTFDNDDSTDFTAPENCILSEPEEFIESYTLNGKPPSPNRKCVPEEQRYVSVVSPRDLGEHSQSQSRKNHQRQSGGCTKHQTQYQEDGHQVCFSTHPLPACKSSCRAKNTISKSVPVHCIEKNNVAELWMKQIDKGANPDFSLKTAHRNIQYEVPQSCE